MKSRLVLAVLCTVALAFCQGTTALLSGTVSDPTGAAVPGAEVSVTNIATGQLVQTTTDEKGQYGLPSMPSGTYKVQIAKPGFKAAVRAGVVMEAGVPATVNMKLELGQATETVLVQGGAEMVQTTSAELSSTITGRQINELPTATRNGMESFVQLPGAQTTTSYRETYINGLPKESINITIDGVNTNDNWLKSSDGFFSFIMPSVDSLEEVTLSTSASGVDATGQGGAQLKFVTKSGTNQYHGGVFWQHRNTFLNSNYYFNNINGLARDIVKLNQAGFHVGGPFKKDKLLFFVNYEIYRLPSSSTFSRTVLPPSNATGNFTYCPSGSSCATNPSLLRTVNVLSLASAANASLPATTRPFGTTVDPIMAKTNAQIWALVQGGNLQNNIASSDYMKNTFRYAASSSNKRDFWTGRLDYNLTVKHHLTYTMNYDIYDAVPDILNSVVPIYPGTGTVLGSDVNAGQRSRRFEGTLSLRSSLSARLTNELRIGATGGTILFYDAASSNALYSQWKGYNPSFGYGLAGVTTTSGPSRRNAPVKDLTETLSWVKGAHQFSFGGTWQSVATWQQSIGSETIPGIAFGLAANDPANTGANAFIVNGNFPGITSGDLTSAGQYYAFLTGRVSSTSGQVVEDENSHKYAHNPAVDRNHMREMGFFAQDTWRISPKLTATIGARVEYQFPFENVNGTYTYVGLDGIWGVSGVGNLFKPGTTPGTVPTFKSISGHDAYSQPAQVLPSVGLAYQLPAKEGLLGILTGHHDGAAVLRAGYSISSTRPGGYNFQSMWGSNKGLFYSISADPSTYPQYFGAPGSVRFTDGSFPTQPAPSAPQFPLSVAFGDSVNDFDPNLKMGYVQSWNIGYQRELGRSTVLEVRYVGNHGVHQWRQINLNETNIYENGFLSEAMIAQNNLAIANGVAPNQLWTIASALKSTNYGNQGLPGQQNLKIIQTALGTTCCNDSTTATSLAGNQVGRVAGTIASNLTRLTNLVNAGYPANMFYANPAAGGGAWLMTNGGASFYDSLQVDVRRRLAHGLQMQASYVWGKSLTNGATANSGDASQPFTLRNMNLDRNPTGFDLRHAIKANWIWEMPFGPGRQYLSSVGNPILRKALEGWELAGTTRIQAGQPSRFTSSRFTINGNDSGVVLHGVTLQQLQDQIGVYKYTNASTQKGVLYDLPLNLVLNSEAAFGQTAVGPDGKAWTFDANQPYIGPVTAPGAAGYFAYLRGPWQKHLDVSLIKRTRIRENINCEFRAQALNVMNITNFYLGSQSVNGTGFGQITSAFRDTSNAVDPGGRILEFVARINF